jgi:hypothetical protein
LSLAVLLAAAVAAETPSVTLHVPSITCPACQQTISRAMAGETRVSRVSFDVGRRVVRLVLADTATPTDSLVQTILSVGYTAIPVVETAAYRLRGPRAAVSEAVSALLSTPGVRAAEVSNGRLVVTREIGRLDDAEIRAVIRRAAPAVRLAALR